LYRQRPITIFLIQTDQIPPPSGSYHLFIAALSSLPNWIFFFFFKRPPPPYRPDYSTMNTTQTNTWQAGKNGGKKTKKKKLNVIQYNFRGTWVKWQKNKKAARNSQAKQKRHSRCLPTSGEWFSKWIPGNL